MRRLAIDGGQPAFAQPRHVGAPNVQDRAGLLRRIEGVLDANWLTNRGPLVEEFESRVAALAGVRNCVTVANGTMGLEVVARAVGLTGEVVVPAHTFVATAHALRWQELHPVFADVDPRTHALDPAAVERMLTSRTSGIMGVHLWGRAGDVAGLARVAERHGLELVYDAAHAFCSRLDGIPLTAFGRASVVSFHATKFLNTFEGGAVLTDDDGLADEVRLMTNFGFEGQDRVGRLGTNAKMTEISAAMGLTQLDGLDALLRANHARLAAYAEGLADVDGLRVLTDPPRQQSNAQYVVVEVDSLRYGRTRDELVELLSAENVMARRYFWPGVHRMEPYASEQPNAGLLLPETERLCDEVLALPTGLGMSLEDVRTVCCLLRAAARAGTGSSDAPSRRAV